MLLLSGFLSRLWCCRLGGPSWGLDPTLLRGNPLAAEIALWNFSCLPWEPSRPSRAASALAASLTVEWFSQLMALQMTLLTRERRALVGHSVWQWLLTFSLAPHLCYTRARPSHVFVHARVWFPEIIPSLCVSCDGVCWSIVFHHFFFFSLLFFL